jgi:hypothetical protein
MCRPRRLSAGHARLRETAAHGEEVRLLREDIDLPACRSSCWPHAWRDACGDSGPRTGRGGGSASPLKTSTANCGAAIDVRTVRGAIAACTYCGTSFAIPASMTPEPIMGDLMLGADFRDPELPGWSARPIIRGSGRLFSQKARPARSMTST